MGIKIFLIFFLKKIHFFC